MKIQALITAVAATALAPCLSVAQPTGAVPHTAIARGTVIEDSLYSPALGVSKRFIVYLPASYATDNVRRYPVAYYLHGTGGNERSWVVGLAIDSVADSLFDHGTSPMILVMPDGDNGYYHTWQTSPDYATCMKWRALLPYGEPAADYCVRRMIAQHKPIPPLWLMVGTEDTSTLEVNRMFHQTLSQLGVKHEYFEMPGGHTMAFWRDHEGESLAWIAGVIAR